MTKRPAQPPELDSPQPSGHSTETLPRDGNSETSQLASLLTAPRWRTGWHWLRRGLPLVPVAGLAALLLGTAMSQESSSTAQDEACPPYEPVMDRYRYLRALSLDLRGHLPSAEEIAQLDELQDVPEEWIDSWLTSADFAGQVVRKHHELLWNNITNVQIYNANDMLGTSGGLYYRRQLATMYRGAAVPCNDKPATYKSDGSLVTEVMSDGSKREGYVMVSPYWNPSTSVKVCGFDAQANAVSRIGTDCSTRDALDDPNCGCGPRLQWCGLDSARGPILQAMGEDLDRRISSMVTRNASYLELFSGRTAYVNGPLTEYYKNQAEFYANVKLTPLSIDKSTLPNLEYKDKDTWVPVTLPEGHAGILTSPGYLVRFQTNRARANRFFNAFLCQPFQPPEGGIPSSGDEIPTQDLQERDGCNYCHTLLEPSAAYWGRWGEQGAGYLAPDTYTPVRDDCQQCALTGQGCSDMCKRSYVIKALTSEEDPYLGMLKSYEFRKPEHVDHIEQGPQMLAQLGVQDGRLPDCVARTAFQWLLGRAPTTDEEGWVDELSYDFVASGYRYGSLVKAIVTDPNYRRVE